MNMHVLSIQISLFLNNLVSSSLLNNIVETMLDDIVRPTMITMIILFKYWSDNNPVSTWENFTCVLCFFMPTVTWLALCMIDILGRGQSGIAEIVARCVVKHAVEPRRLGYPCTARQRPGRSTEEDRPEEIVEERDPNQLLEGEC